MSYKNVFLLWVATAHSSMHDAKQRDMDEPTSSITKAAVGDTVASCLPYWLSIQSGMLLYNMEKLVW